MIAAERTAEMKHSLPSVLMVSILLFSVPAWAVEKTQAFDYIRFPDNGNDIVIDLPGLLSALRNGADPNWIDRRQKRAISTLSHFVQLIGISRNPDVDAVGVQAVKALIAAGAKLQSVDRAILFWPISNGKADIVALLLDIGADAATWPNNEIVTPLSPVETAAEEGHQAIVDLLVMRGATRPNERDAIQLRFLRAARYDDPTEILDELLKKGATVNGKGRNDEVALINAAGLAVAHGCKDPRNGYMKILYLLNIGADPNMSGKGQFVTTTFPLHQAAWSTSFLNNSEAKLCGEMVLSELIKRGAHVSAMDSDGRTPLHIAAERNNLFAARLLLKAGAKVMLTFPRLLHQGQRS